MYSQKFGINEMTSKIDRNLSKKELCFGVFMANHLSPMAIYLKYHLLALLFAQNKLEC